MNSNFDQGSSSIAFTFEDDRDGIPPNAIVFQPPYIFSPSTLMITNASRSFASSFCKNYASIVGLGNSEVTRIMLAKFNPIIRPDEYGLLGNWLGLFPNLKDFFIEFHESAYSVDRTQFITLFNTLNPNHAKLSIVASISPLLPTLPNTDTEIKISDPAESAFSTAAPAEASPTPPTSSSSDARRKRLRPSLLSEDPSTAAAHTQTPHDDESDESKTDDLAGSDPMTELQHRNMVLTATNVGLIARNELLHRQMTLLCEQKAEAARQQEISACEISDLREVIGHLGADAKAAEEAQAEFRDTIQNLKARLQALTASTERLTSKTDADRKKIGKKESGITQLRAELQEVNVIRAGLTEKLATSTLETKSLKAEIQRLQTALEEAKIKHTRELSDQQSSSNHKIEQLHTQQLISQQELSQSRTTIADREAQLKLFTAENETIRAKLEAARRQIQKAEEASGRLKAEIQEALAVRSGLTENLAKSTLEIRSLKTEIQKLHTALQETEAKYKHELSAQQSASDNQISLLRTQQLTSQEQSRAIIADREAQLKSLATEKEKIRAELEAARKQIQKAEETSNRLQAEIQRLHSASKETEAKYERELDAQKSTLTHQLQQLQTRKLTLEQELSQREIAIEGQKSQLAALCAEKADIADTQKQENATKERFIHRLQTQIQRLKAAKGKDATTHKTKIDQLKAKIAELSQQNQQLTTTNQSAGNTTQKQMQTIKDLRSLQEETANTISILRAEKTCLNTRIQSAEKILDKTKQSLAESEASLTQLQSKMSNLAQERNAAIARNKEMADTSDTIAVSLRSQIKGLAEKLRAKDAALRQHTERIATLQSQVVTINHEKETSDQRRVAAEQALHEKQTQLASAIATSEQSTRDLESTQRRLQEQSASAQQLQVDISHLTIQNQQIGPERNAPAASAQKDQQISQLQQYNTQLLQQLTNVTKQKERLQRELQAQVEFCDMLRNDRNSLEKQLTGAKKSRPRNGPPNTNPPPTRHVEGGIPVVAFWSMSPPVFPLPQSSSSSSSSNPREPAI